MVRKWMSYLMILAILSVVWVGCASTGIGKAVQAADAQKQLVERAAVEFVKLKLKNDPRITPAVYERGRAAYEKYQATQATLADSLASWKVVSNAENESKLQTALNEATKNIEAYLAFVGQFVDLTSLKAKLKASVEADTPTRVPTWSEIITAAGWEFQLVWRY